MAEVKIFGEHDERTKEQMARCMQHGSVVGGVLCADGHLGYAQPVGGVIAYEDHISLSGVGFDIACGNMAVKLDLPKKAIEDRVGRIAEEIAANVSFGLGRSNAEKVEHNLFDSPLWQEAEAIGHLKGMARDQLGTVGSGNHYVDLFEDEAGLVWIGVHFGSRGLGHKTATAFIKLAGGKDGIDVAPTVLHQDSDLGQQYLAGMTLAGLYAYAGREWVVERVRSIVGGEVIDTVHNHHNYAWSFYSTVHGAGRVMSRTEARGRFVRDPQSGKKIRQPGRVRHDEMQAWLRNKGVHLVGGDLDEAPQAYRRLPDVLAHHAGTVAIEHRLRPFAVVMAGADVFDPFKD